MVWHDFPPLNEDEYANRISEYTNEQLSALSAHSRRQIYLIRREQKLLEAELAKRGVPLRENRNHGSDAVAASSQVEAGACSSAPSTSPATCSAITTRVHALIKTLRLQTGVRGTGLGLCSADDIPSEEFNNRALHFGHDLSRTAAPDPYETYRALSEVIKSNGAMKLQTLVEVWTTTTAASRIPWRTSDILLGCLKTINGGKCVSSMGLSIGCDHCADKIENGDYWHCCECDGFHVCINCYSNGRRCPEAAHAMRNLRVTKAAQLFLDDSAYSAYTGWKVTEATPVLSRSLFDSSPAAMFICHACSAQVYQGLNYHCPDCLPLSFDMCERCFTSGAKCEGDDHKLVVAPAALDCSRNPQVVGDCHRRSKGPAEALLLASGRVQAMNCDICEAQIVQGCFYHCCNCGDDDLDICHSCYVSGARCKKPTSHALQLYLADSLDHSCLSKIWPVACQRRSQGWLPRDMKGRNNCSLCGNLFGDDACFWHCCLCYVNGKYDNFDICRSCYREGGGCDDRLHLLTCHSLR
ncbi:hypothetical protein RB595_008521 [Gaeumannomyces hyphopodioides]